MVGVGEALKIIRDEKGITLKEISHRTNINIHSLQALENEDYSQIPGKFHYLNYLKAYLCALNIEENGFLEMYSEHLDNIPFKKENGGEAYFTKLKYYRFKKRKALPYVLAALVLVLVLLYILFFNPFNISWGEIFDNHQIKKSAAGVHPPSQKTNHLPEEILQ